MAISMLKIRRPLGRLIFDMGIAIPGKTVFLIETAPWNFWFLNENVSISIQISLKFVRHGPINNNPVLVQIMAWRRLGIVIFCDKSQHITTLTSKVYMKILLLLNKWNTTFSLIQKIRNHWSAILSVSRSGQCFWSSAVECKLFF